jgi:hypothetical protein
MNSCRSYGPASSGETYRAPLIHNLNTQPGMLRQRLFVDSRDCIANLDSFAFTVYLSDPFRDTSIGVAPFERVKSVELKALAFPKTTDEYVIMDIEELNDERLHSSNQPANRSFAVMYFDASTLATGDVKPMKGYDFYQKDISYNPIIAKLNKLTVQFKDRTGNVITKASTNNVNHCSFMLEITSLTN